jgi:hypothetical protein
MDCEHVLIVNITGAKGAFPVFWQIWRRKGGENASMMTLSQSVF